MDKVLKQNGAVALVALKHQVSYELLNNSEGSLKLSFTVSCC